MDESTKATIEKFQTKLAGLEAQARKIKVAVNGLCELEGEPLLYPDAETETTAANDCLKTIRPDQFFGRPTATVVREVLTARFQRNQGAISLDELYSILTQGGFVPDGKDETVRKRTLAITIGKNPAFTRLPSGYIGLAEWYPNAKRKVAQVSAEGNGDNDLLGDLVEREDQPQTGGGDLAADQAAE